MHLILKASGVNAGVVSHLLAKNPNNVYDRTDKGVRVRMVYTKASEQETEVLIHAEPDPVDLVRGTPDGYDITQYINDREFVTSSLFCSYIRNALGTALNGRPKEDYVRWVDHAFELELKFGPVASDLPDRVVEELFSCLGYDITVERGESAYSFDLKNRSTVRHITLRGKQTIQQALRQLFLLIPVLDNYKHYFISEDEIDKINRYGEGWLDSHPLKGLIVRRTLHFAELIRTYERQHGALDDRPSRLEQQAEEAEGDLKKTLKSESAISRHEDKNPNADTVQATSADRADDSSEIPARLNDLRYRAITDIVDSLPEKRRIVDMGAGEGKLSARLAYIPGVESILAVEPSGQSRLRAMERFAKMQDRAGVQAMPEPMLGSLFYFDEQLQYQDVIILCEVIEHIEAYRLNGIMETILKEYRPQVLLVTTPNKEYNEVYAMEQEQFRHHDHRFEWTREEFNGRCAEWAEKGNYAYEIRGIGEEKEGYGQPTQLAMFTRGKEEHV
ncbi:3' terminal RNA ribose 2'-O-methyltransferase Hen1 [Paenibacillus polysaccharolyticus]|uniref:methyltransferase domain-containing protein n=1 Tax=Paenibacillus polysaccharolyticus TaxID=582692 RepID=UPI00209CB5EE|nr:methyltransferase domain-containing protein [Paenibacillus polysaccharolyticus]MCP1135643.1 3' terminal RNA ribose 2'-O-methyltransferase Hen1 [Paenibacillus polysaccharolyticus]